MKKSLKKLFLLDDRTGLHSTTKLIRWLTWLISVVSIINLQAVIYFNSVEITADDVSLLSIVERLIMTILGFTEGSYQVNRYSKMRFGNAEAQKAEEVVFDGGEPHVK